jgi:retron-type reverse transcriptase
MVSILAEKIHDPRFLRLITQVLQAGYREEWRSLPTLSGVPQGGIVSPILSNISLDTLDTCVETHLIPQDTQGQVRKKNPADRRLQERLSRARRKEEYRNANALRRKAQHLPAGDPHDPTSRRLRDVRSADDVRFGFLGPRAEAEQITQERGTVLQHTLTLE